MASKKLSGFRTAIGSCKCASSFQDATYGLNKRVHNFAPAQNGGKGAYRCTVCGTVHNRSEMGIAEVVEVKKEDVATPAKK